MRSRLGRLPKLSCELFPPHTDYGIKKLAVTCTALMKIHPSFFSITTGRQHDQSTFQVIEIMKMHNVDTVPHITCVTSTRIAVREILYKYKMRGIRHLLVLRGDLPSGIAKNVGEFNYANELVEFIRSETGNYFYIVVAAYPEFHPQAISAKDDLLNFKRKVEAGADSAITQYFYNPESYFRFIDDCEKLGLNLPIIPGIMPILDFSKLSKFSESCGAEIPRWIYKRFESFDGNHHAIRSYGLEIVTNMCQRLLDNGVPGLHFYTMNNHELTLAISQRLGLLDKLDI